MKLTSTGAINKQKIDRRSKQKKQEQVRSTGRQVRKTRSYINCDRRTGEYTSRSNGINKLKKVQQDQQVQRELQELHGTTGAIDRRWSNHCHRLTDEAYKQTGARRETNRSYRTAYLQADEIDKGHYINSNGSNRCNQQAEGFRCRSRSSDRRINRIKTKSNGINRSNRSNRREETGNTLPATGDTINNETTPRESSTREEEQVINKCRLHNGININRSNGTKRLSAIHLRRFQD